LDKSLKNFAKLLRFLSENIYDRPVENLLCYLEILKLIISNFETSFILLDKEENKATNADSGNNVNNIFYLNAFYKAFEGFVFNRGLAFSLISLLRQSWALVRCTSFSILKNKSFFNIVLKEREVLTDEILRNVNSLRQMDAEGSVNLFLLLIHHLKTEFFEFFLERLSKKNKIQLIFTTKSVSSSSIEKKTNQNSLEILKEILIRFIDIINSKRESYFNFVNKSSSKKQENSHPNKTDIDDSGYYIHSYFIFIRTALEEIKESPDLFSYNTNDFNNEEIFNFASLLNNLSNLVISLNAQFKLMLVNNGVAEFNTIGEDENECFESEDKRLISLWISTKFSLESLNLCYDITNKFYKIIPKDEKFEIILMNIQLNIADIIDLMIDYKHMGAICGLNDALLNACRIVRLLIC